MSRQFEEHAHALRKVPGKCQNSITVADSIGALFRLVPSAYLVILEGDTNERNRLLVGRRCSALERRGCRPGTEADKPPQGSDAKCGFACHTAVKNQDYIFTAYPKR
jgi:hypothetical protein